MRRKTTCQVDRELKVLQEKPKLGIKGLRSPQEPKPPFSLILPQNEKIIQRSMKQQKFHTSDRSQSADLRRPATAQTTPCQFFRRSQLFLKILMHYECQRITIIFYPAACTRTSAASQYDMHTTKHNCRSRLYACMCE